MIKYLYVAITLITNDALVLRIDRGGLEMVKYLYVAIIIMNDEVLVLWRGRKGFLPSLGC